MKPILFVIVFLSFVASLCWGQDSTLMQISIKSDKKMYETGEKIQLTAALKNISKEPLMVLRPFEMVGQRKDLEIYGSHGVCPYRGPQKEWSWGEGSYARLDAGKSITESYEVVNEYYDMCTPGVYTIKYIYMTDGYYENFPAKNGVITIKEWKGKITSNSIKIGITIRN